MINWTFFRIFGTIAIVFFCIIGTVVFTFLLFVLITWIQQEIRMRKEAKQPARVPDPVPAPVSLFDEIERYLHEVRQK